MSSEYVCFECHMTLSQTILDWEGVIVVVPDRPHISVADGGHLLVVPKRHVRDRRDLTDQEALDIFKGSRIAAEALAAAFGTDWFNFQENGNWSLDGESDPHMHLHVYGRARTAVHQPFGEALRFPRGVTSPIGGSRPSSRNRCWSFDA